MILTHESGAQEDQFDGKKEGQKSRGTIPLNKGVNFIHITSKRRLLSTRNWPQNLFLLPFGFESILCE